jgi:ketosteroid isomerase-like protein
MSEHIDLPIHELQSVLIGPADPDIVMLEARLRAAQLCADVSALNTLIAENLLFTGPDGQLASKADDLAMHRSGAVRIRAHDPEELRIRRVGADVAVVALRARLTVEANGALVMQGPVRYTRVWAREDGGDGAWCVVAGHVSAIPG